MKLQGLHRARIGHDASGYSSGTGDLFSCIWSGAETESAAEALKSIKDLKPDVVIVDLSLKEGTHQLLSALRLSELYRFHLLFNDYLIEALQFAQVDFVKPFDISDLITTIDKVSDSHKPKSSVFTASSVWNINQ